MFLTQEETPSRRDDEAQVWGGVEPPTQGLRSVFADDLKTIERKNGRAKVIETFTGFGRTSGKAVSKGIHERRDHVVDVVGMADIEAMNGVVKAWSMVLSARIA